MFDWQFHEFQDEIVICKFIEILWAKTMKTMKTPIIVKSQIIQVLSSKQKEQECLGFNCFF